MDGFDGGGALSGERGALRCLQPVVHAFSRGGVLGRIAVGGLGVGGLVQVAAAARGDEPGWALAVRLALLA